VNQPHQQNRKGRCPVEINFKPNVPATMAHLKGVYERAVMVKTQHDKTLAEFNGEVAKRRADVDRRIQETDFSRRDDAKRLYESEYSDWLRAHRKATSGSRWKDAAEMQTLRDQAVQSRELLANPIAIATVYKLGSPERNAVAMEVNGLGPAALGNLAKVAVGSKDKAMIGVLVLANDRLPAKIRPFDSHDLAEMGFGDDAAEAAKLIHTVDRLHAESLAAVRASEGTPLKPIESIAHGLKFERAGGMGPQPHVKGPKPETATTKIAEGLAAL